LKHTTLITSTFLLCTLAFIVPAHSQAFKKGSLLVGLTEGSTSSVYSVGENNNPVRNEPIHGVRDPLSLEYGITNHWGIGISMGTDIFNINPNSFYGTDGLPVTGVKSTTSELTLDASYHFYVSKRNDLSLTASVGSSSVSIKGNNGDSKYQYTANGGIMRFGIHARHYFCKRIGVIGMLT